MLYVIDGLLYWVNGAAAQVKRGKEGMVREYIGKALETNGWGEARLVLQLHDYNNSNVVRARTAMMGCWVLSGSNIL